LLNNILVEKYVKGSSEAPFFIVDTYSSSVYQTLIVSLLNKVGCSLNADLLRLILAIL